MDVEFLTGRPFQGWTGFKELLGQVDPARAIGFIQIFTKNMASQQNGVFLGPIRYLPPTYTSRSGSGFATYLTMFSLFKIQAQLSKLLESLWMLAAR